MRIPPAKEERPEGGRELWRRRRLEKLSPPRAPEASSVQAPGRVKCQQNFIQYIITALRTGRFQAIAARPLPCCSCPASGPSTAAGWGAPGSPLPPQGQLTGPGDESSVSARATQSQQGVRAMNHKPHLLHLLLHLLVGPQHFLSLLEPQLQPSDLRWEMSVRNLPQNWAGRCLGVGGD